MDLLDQMWRSVRILQKDEWKTGLLDANRLACFIFSPFSCPGAGPGLG